MPQPLRVVTLELSLKPFRDGFGAENVERIVRGMFRQWDALTRHAEAVQVMLWASDGSEILEFTGDLDAGMEWARFIGGANRHQTFEYDPKREALHARAYDYCTDPPRLTYRAYRDLLATIKRVGAEATGAPIRLGTTFDPGPEFAKSKFKYEWHNEICLGNTMGTKTFVCCYATLDADRRRYAAFPDGIPQGLPFGTFLGAQSREFCAAMGFDMLWLSNGIGYGMETWGSTGAVFDGKAFHPERRNECGARNQEFWRLLRKELPDLAIETRGTNLTTGVDIASDGVPLRAIYEGGFNFQAPPNSPWAALNQDFGLELAGWMSHVAELPPDNPGFLFRYYIHDPWWLNSPWLDRYGREAHDIWLPGAVARLDARGATCIPDRINLLTVDDSLGDMPERVPNEVIPHLLECRRTAPDQAGPLVWVYPFDEYHDRAFGAEAAVEEPFFGDWLVRGAINEGLPLNTVMSTRAYLAARQADPQALADRILVTPVPREGDAVATQLCAHVAAGGKVLLYGPTAQAGETLRKLIGVAAAEPVSGVGEVVLAVPDDRCATPAPRRMEHRSVLNCGGCAETAAEHTEVLAWFDAGQQRRAIATLRRRLEWNGGAVAWVRGTNTVEQRWVGGLPHQDPPGQGFPGERLLRLALGRIGWSIRAARRTPGQGAHSLTIHRSANGWWFAGLARSTNVTLALRAPDGAPLLLGHDAWLEDGHAVYALPRAWRRECRVFVDQAAVGEVSCVEGTHERIGAVRRFWIHGLQDATVTIYPETDRTAIVLLDPPFPFLQGRALEQAVEDGGRRVVCRRVSGSLCVTW